MNAMTLDLMKNRYAGKCAVCFQPVSEGRGWFDRETRHTLCGDHAHVEVVSSAVPPAAPVDLEDPAIVTKLADAAAQAVSAKLVGVWLETIPLLVRTEVEALTKVAEIKIGKAPAVKVNDAHKALPTILQAIHAGASPFLVGPAGSGKTTLAEQCAKLMKLKFYMAARVTSEYKLVGFVNATGQTVRTQFREAYEHGGVFLFDEVDASDPDALTAFNAALSNGIGDFPDGMVPRHANFHAIAAGNTYGRGADRQYVGRNQLDAATLDRFQVFDIDYDEQLELKLAGDAKWTKHCQAIRRAIEHEKVRHIVSPRASIAGAKLLAVGMAWSVVEEACVWKGLPDDARKRVEYRMASQGAA